MKTRSPFSLAKVRLWSGNLWLICLANLLVSVSLYMLVPTFPVWLVERFGTTLPEAGVILALSGFSIFLLGPFFNYLVDTFRRKGVCLWAIALGVLVTAGYYWAPAVAWIACMRVVHGMLEGVALMAGGSTLAIDLTQSPRRTEANSAFAWFGRLGFSLGPFAGLLLMRVVPFQMVLVVSCLLGVAAVLCVALLKVPFRAPLCPPPLSLDRFWLQNGWLMFVQVIPLGVAAGLLLSSIHQYEFYALLMVGFCLSILALSAAFRTADIRAEVVCGLLCWGAGLMLLVFRSGSAALYGAGILTGLGLGLAASRLLVFYIKLSHHCERGSANTSYLLGWELGLAIGLCVGYTLYNKVMLCYQVALGVVALALLLYVGIVHRWFMKHKVR